MSKVERLSFDQERGIGFIRPEIDISNAPQGCPLREGRGADGRERSLLEDFVIKGAFAGVSGPELQKAMEAMSDDLTWVSGGDSPARINGTAFLNAADRVKYHQYSLQEQAEQLHTMFGISVKEATARIKAAEDRI